ncbi:thioesterase II family protein [Paenibacillus plantarum]|uniref:thioesterase II family protein n=1 Tax=Paenibacillus plantarum TaxID=2654975 RepID=UPI00149115EF|nr:alpha/beta fold hydrolase [Paenibacillus plantarum]
MKRKRLFCIPYAGGLAGYYLRFNRLLDSSWVVCPIELAGRGSRTNDAFYSSMDDAVEDVYRQITDQINDEPYFIFGHSMGALIAYEVCLKLVKSTKKMPVHVFFSAKNPPYISETTQYSKMSNQELLNELKKWGGTPSHFFDDPKLFEHFLPIIRSDLTMIDKGQLKDEIIYIDITVMWGKEDKDRRMMQGWENMTFKTCRFVEFEGGHFYINDKLKEVSEIINDTAELINRNSDTWEVQYHE